MITIMQKDWNKKTISKLIQNIQMIGPYKLANHSQTKDNIHQRDNTINPRKTQSGDQRI